MTTSGPCWMPIGDSAPEILVDTSVAIALLVADHEHHAATLKAIGHRRAGLAGHAAFETFSVLTRMPAPIRRPPDVVAQLMAENFPENRYLSQAAANELVGRLVGAHVSGGAVYDALVGATAAEHGIPLATRDQR